MGSPGKEQSFSPLPGIEPRFLFPAAHCPVSILSTLPSHLKMRNAYTILAGKSYGNEIGRLRIREVDRTGSEKMPVAAFCKGGVQSWCSAAAEFSLSCQRSTPDCSSRQSQTPLCWLRGGVRIFVELFEQNLCGITSVFNPTNSLGGLGKETKVTKASVVTAGFGFPLQLIFIKLQL